VSVGSLFFLSLFIRDSPAPITCVILYTILNPIWFRPVTDYCCWQIESFYEFSGIETVLARRTSLTSQNGVKHPLRFRGIPYSVKPPFSLVFTRIAGTEKLTVRLLSPFSLLAGN